MSKRSKEEQDTIRTDGIAALRLVQTQMADLLSATTSEDKLRFLLDALAISISVGAELGIAALEDME